MDDLMVNIIKEDYIEESILELLGDIFEYDSVVNDMNENNVLDEDDIEDLNLSKKKMIMNDNHLLSMYGIVTWSFSKIFFLFTRPNCFSWSTITF